MGTRSLTTFIETYKDEETGKQKKQEIVTMYRQYDGYPEGHGSDLAEFLSTGELVNGIGMNDKIVFNGMGCLSAQVVAHFKEGAGGIYLQRANKDSWENYRYQVIGDFDTKELTIKILEVGYMKGDRYCKGTRTLFEGTPKEMLKFCREPQEA